MTRSYAFRGSMPREVLESYLSRAITMSEFCCGKGDTDDAIRMIRDTGAKFIGRAAYVWGGEGRLADVYATTRVIAAKAHAADPDLILQAAAFEIVTPGVESVTVPADLAAEFGFPREARPFDYEAMLFEDGTFVGHWGRQGSVPDITRPETQMWFSYLVRNYIDAGIEAIHFGQIALMGRNDRDRKQWRAVLERCRDYARTHARRGMLVCDAHTPFGGPVIDGHTLFDFHSFPLRIRPVVDKPQEGILEKGYLDSIFGRSNGGVTPSGWRCDSLPYLVELDNFGVGPKPGEPGDGSFFTWGYDEICWFARQPAPYRDQWLRYAWKWVRETDPAGFLQMPGSRTLAAPVGDRQWYYANTPSAVCPDGFGDETTIREIWAADR